MARWEDVLAAEPDLAERARTAFDAHVHKTIATLRRDGSPRISGIEIRFAEGDVWIGSMKRAVKALDLQRDPRYALHSGSDEPDAWQGDAKIAGEAEEIHDQAVLDRVYPPDEDEPERKLEDMYLFRLEISELVWTGLNEARDALIVDSWTAGRGRRTIER